MAATATRTRRREAKRGSPPTSDPRKFSVRVGALLTSGRDAAGLVTAFARGLRGGAAPAAATCRAILAEAGDGTHAPA